MSEKERSIIYKLTPKEKENLLSFMVVYAEDGTNKSNLRAFFGYVETLISERDLTHDDFAYQAQLASAAGKEKNEA